jgi:hypothetical protein
MIYHLSGWVESKAIDTEDFYNTSEFLYEGVICPHSCPWRIVLDGGRENLDFDKSYIGTLQNLEGCHFGVSPASRHFELLYRRECFYRLS